jgi:hypothetical protein
VKSTLVQMMWDPHQVDSILLQLKSIVEEFNEINNSF